MHMFLLDSLSVVNVFQNLGKHHEVKQKTMIQHVFQSQGCYIFDQYWANTIKYNKLATSRMLRFLKLRKHYKVQKKI